MSKTRNLSDLLDANGDVKSGALDNVPAFNEAGADTTAIVADKQNLRDLPAVVDIATTTDEIKAVWNDMLGDKE